MAAPPAVVRSRFAVRSYELDAYAHMNNAVYLGWFEQGRLDWLQARGYSYASLAGRGCWLVVVRTEIDFRRALGLGDEVELTTEVAGLGRTSVTFRQAMRRAGPDGTRRRAADGGGAPPDGGGGAGRGDDVVAEALTVMAFTDTERALPVPGDFRAAAGRA